MTGQFELAPHERPNGLVYPQIYLRLVESGAVAIAPWHLFIAAQQLQHRAGLHARYPDRNLFPFARRQDNDDIACWDLGAPPNVVIIHDFASPGHEQRGSFATTCDWLRQALEDFIEFEA